MKRRQIKLQNSGADMDPMDEMDLMDNALINVIGDIVDEYTADVAGIVKGPNFHGSDGNGGFRPGGFPAPVGKPDADVELRGHGGHEGGIHADFNTVAPRIKIPPATAQ